MSDIITAIEKEQLKQNLPEFSAGDTVIVKVKVKEGERTRLQAFEGVVIAVKNRGINSAFTVRKISHGEGVERTFQTHSPLIDSIEIKRKGAVRKSKIYYLRERTGKAARIKEDLSHRKTKASKVQEETKSETKPETKPETKSETKEVKKEEKPKSETKPETKKDEAKVEKQQPKEKEVKKEVKEEPKAKVSKEEKTSKGDEDKS